MVLIYSGSFNATLARTYYLSFLTFKNKCLITALNGIYLRAVIFYTSPAKITVGIKNEPFYGLPYFHQYGFESCLASLIIAGEIKMLVVRSVSILIIFFAS
ncbi:hypothetical protein [Maridesulfovibrio sp.]|uniref:hypothetical protein n=1 Tax=Maridesulfovibrio sp. TaxID=2795000 RepID=UPI0029F4FC9A|nr:hypothetical protein [Maridesulfovibrio sp.]